MNTDIEKFRPEFNLETYREARERTWLAIVEIREQITVGMQEEAALQIFKKILTDIGFEKHWHSPKIRFGSNTLKKFSEPSDPGKVLQANDIYFVDIGPVWKGYEGDAGTTITVGDDEEMQNCARAAKEIFDLTQQHWEKTQCRGPELYQIAEKLAQDRGWVLNLEVNGHRLSDFPHQVYFRKGLTHISFAPKAWAWVLEIQIRHPTRALGAFYEDILF